MNRQTNAALSRRRVDKKAGLPAGLRCRFHNPRPEGKPMNTIVLREIDVQDSAGNRYTVEVMQDMRMVIPLSGRPVPVPRQWYRCNGAEVTQEGTGFQAGRLLLLPLQAAP